MAWNSDVNDCTKYPICMETNKQKRGSFTKAALVRAPDLYLECFAMIEMLYI